MKKLISKIVSAVLCGAIFFGVSAAAGCKKQPEYAAEQDKYLFGMCELTSETMPSAVDSGVTNEWTAKKNGRTRRENGSGVDAPYEYPVPRGKVRRTVFK